MSPPQNLPHGPVSPQGFKRFLGFTVQRLWHEGWAPFGQIPHRIFIVIPLVVMLLLVGLVGMVSIQTAQKWQSVAEDVTDSTSRLLILNNVYGALLDTHDLQKKDKVEAQKQWRLVQSQIDFLTRTQGTSSVPLALRVFLADDSNIENIEAFMVQKSVFFQNQSRIRNRLLELQEYTQRVSWYTTLSFIGLGLLLMVYTAWDLWRSFRQVTQSRDMYNLIQEEERRRIAQDLHDDVIQSMIDLKRHYTSEKLEDIVQRIRRICQNLKPQILDDLGWIGAIDFLADDLRQTAAIDVQVSIEDDYLEDIPKRYELPLFRAIQELLNNIRKHAGANWASIRLMYNPRESNVLRVYVQDNGVGFDPQTVKLGLGISGVQQRIQALGGTVRYIPSPAGRGTLCLIHLPVTGQQEDV